MLTKGNTMNVTINGQQVIKEPPADMVKAALALLSPTEEDLTISLRDRIAVFEAHNKKQPQLNLPVKHKFISGLYRREITFPKDMIATGKVHKLPHMDEMITGEMIVVTEDGIKHLVAPCSLITLVGSKKFGVALKETTWVSFHPTSCTTVKDVEAEIMCEDWAEIELSAEYSDITDIIKSRDDFSLAIKELGHTRKQLREEAESDNNRLYTINSSLYVSTSNIEGKGVFANRAVTKGEQFLSVTSTGCRTDLCRYVNHSGKPNTKPYVCDHSVYLVAIRDIDKDEELTVNYRGL